MVKLTLIARASDGLPLAEGLDTDKDPLMERYKAQAKVRRGERKDETVAWCVSRWRVPLNLHALTLSLSRPLSAALFSPS